MELLVHRFITKTCGFWVVNKMLHNKLIFKDVFTSVIAVFLELSSFFWSLMWNYPFFWSLKDETRRWPICLTFFIVNEGDEFIYGRKTNTITHL
ncbi:hypothetical protein QE152_g19423 [Popillia japonica]|uniref:Uncharacterized protein n=1 Tax=Popillia japonica TaxID=7064 RepID=A0AAW1KRK8_POPJA